MVGDGGIVKPSRASRNVQRFSSTYYWLVLICKNVSRLIDVGQIDPSCTLHMRVCCFLIRDYTVSYKINLSKAFIGGGAMQSRSRQVISRTAL